MELFNLPVKLGNFCRIATTKKYPGGKQLLIKKLYLGLQ